MTEPVALHLRVTGVVQGVGYRHFAAESARERGVVGWVRNRRDGSVECWVEGERAAVEAFVADLWRGPRLAEVRGVRSEAVRGESPGGFRVLPTG